MIKLTEAQIQILRDLGFEYLVVNNSYTNLVLLKSLGEKNFNLVLGKLGITGTWSEHMTKGNLQDIVKFREFLKTSNVYRAALLAGQQTPAVRKLVFELTFWVSSEVGEMSPNTILAVWQELNVLTKGAIKQSIAQLDVDAWNQAIKDCQLADGFKL